MSVTQPERDSPEERKQVAEALALLGRIAERPSRPWDAVRFLSDGGPVGLTPRAYVEELLGVVNFSLHTKDGPTDIFILTATGAAPIALYCREPELGGLIADLDQIRADPAAARRKFEAQWEKSLRGCVATVPVRGEERVILSGNGAAWAFVLRSLAAEPLCDELCRCQWPECGRFFLFSYDRTGGPPQYCALPEAKDTRGRTCADRARLKKQRERQAALRAGMSVEDFRQFKKTGRRPARRHR